MPFEAVAQWLTRARCDQQAHPRVQLRPVGLAAFSDDLELDEHRRVSVRVVLRDCEDGYAVDLTDSDDASAQTRFRLTKQEAQLACRLALRDAGQPVEDDAVQVSVGEHSWIGAGPANDAAATAFGICRVYDAVQGALAQAWSDRCGAGSCTLGAIVEIQFGKGTVTEVLPGGEGGLPHRDGADAWSGPVLPTQLADPHELPGLVLALQVRAGSGGAGARRGGDGVRRTYASSRPFVARVAIDRRNNPPHGIDRAGPPQGARVFLETMDGRVLVEPWEQVSAPAFAQLVVETAGGAGHGFPGYGDIDYQPM